MLEHKLIRCEPDDPNRCQATGGSGQCPYLRQEPSKYCHRYGGNNEKENVNNYRLQIWQQRLSEFTQNDNIKSLRDEIGILRILMEEMLNKCSDSTQLMIYSSKISDLAIKIERVVTSCNRLETRMGMLLDKGAALNLASQIVSIITNYVKDPGIVDQISGGIIDALASLTVEEK